MLLVGMSLNYASMQSYTLQQGTSKQDPGHMGDKTVELTLALFFSASINLSQLYPAHKTVC